MDVTTVVPSRASFQPSYCCTCDLPTHCPHEDRRYLDPIVYEMTELGWRVPDHERRRWDSNRWLVDRAEPNDIHHPDPMSFLEVVALLERHVFLGENIRIMLHDAYDATPAQTSLLALEVARSSERLDSPAGFLVNRLRGVLAMNGLH